uniref:Globin domain-containing protein n=1 Tax=Gasterosteus aculeatus aculeatus TaxID=481459 RepID=A0AAQ4PZI6_GASAC
MVVWTDFERSTIQDIFSKMDYEVVGPAALTRCLIVYPWTQRYFGNFGNLYNAAAIMGNPMVAKHGTTILHGLDRGVKNMDDLKATYAELSVLHSEKLHVDPDNFKLLSDCLTIVVAAKLGKAFTGEVQAAFQKFLAVVVSHRLPLDSEVFRQLRKPLQRRRDHGKSDGCKTRHHNPPRPGPRCEEHGRPQDNLRRAERAALRETARGPRQLQAPLRLPDHRGGCSVGQSLHCRGPGSFPEVPGRGGVLPGKTVPLESCN